MKRFNIRVYGLWMEDGKVLVSKESVKGGDIIKFPGGGLEFGEGTIDCLKREWIEELNCEIEVVQHFYTTDFYQPSAFDDSQVLSIYYEIRPLQTISLPVFNGREHFYLSAIDASLLAAMSLPIDKVVTKMLLENF